MQARRLLLWCLLPFFNLASQEKRGQGPRLQALHVLEVLAAHRRSAAGRRGSRLPAVSNAKAQRAFVGRRVMWLLERWVNIATPLLWLCNESEGSERLWSQCLQWPRVGVGSSGGAVLALPLTRGYCSTCPLASPSCGGVELL